MRGQYLNTLLRFLSYALTRLTVLAIIVMLIILAVFIGYDIANINVTVNEGLSKRAEVILNNQDISELGKFYTQEHLNRDPELSRHTYGDFTISGYDHRIKVKKIWVWPWQNKTKVRVEEIITQIEASSNNEDSEDKSIPAWESGEKIIVLEKNGKWKIEDIIMINPIEPETENEDNQDNQKDEDQGDKKEENQEENQEDNQ